MSTEFEMRGRDYIAMLDYMFTDIYAHNRFSGYLLMLVIASLEELHAETESGRKIQAGFLQMHKPKEENLPTKSAQ